MTDAKLKNGDIERDSAGRFVMLSERDAKFQRAFIRISATLGSFIYDRGLGLRLDTGLSGEAAKEKLELMINEALVKYEDTYAKVLEIGNTLKLEVTVDGESKTEEVRFYGNV